MAASISNLAAVFWFDCALIRQEVAMHLKFKVFDGRSSKWVPVIDSDTGKQVGYISSKGTGKYLGGGIDISLFNGKYRTTVTRYEAVLGFVRGVETVLNRMTSIDDGQVEPTLQPVKEEPGPFPVA
jgi:hypothetical protein